MDRVDSGFTRRLFMPSPFPGMDPYLERFWRDVHSSLITYARDSIQDRLPTDLIARIEERVFVETPDGPGRSMHPDVRVVERPGRAAPGAALDGVAVAEPEVVFVSDEPVTETFVEIREAGSGRRVITSIEFQSPTNKLPGPGQDLYLQKEKDLRRANVSLVEVDLIRTGRRLLAGSPYSIPDPQRTAYVACGRRGWEPFRLEVYRMSIRERLVAIRIPLRQTDPDVPLDLQTLVDQAYLHGRYELGFNYRQPPDPPLAPDDSAWMNELLRARGLR
jgi:hypothetical protein